MQRLDYNVLVPYLQPKLEYVISINMTALQKKLYQYYLDNYAKAGQVMLSNIIMKVLNRIHSPDWIRWEARGR